ncbi:MAG TPA: hypothetical protein VGS21_03960, partial [Acidimicrobiales bacterium]|nr:hypothetical protein [Acidimicrobiales bacterium]
MQRAPDQVVRFAPAVAIVGVSLYLDRGIEGVTVQGLVLGSLYALTALGMALVYRSNKVLNFAQADLGMAPSVLAYGLVGVTGAEYFLGLLTGLAAAMLLGGVVEFVVVRRFARAPRLLLTVATIGVSQLLIVASLVIPDIWSSSLLSNLSIHVPIGGSFYIAPIVFTSDDVFAVVVAVVTLSVIAIAFRKSSLGVVLRASADAADRAASLGIPVRRLQTGVWSMSAGLSFLAIFLNATILGLPITDTSSLSPLLVALAALALGGFVDLPSITVSAVALGIFWEAISYREVSNPNLVEALIAGVVVIGILLRRRPGTRAEQLAAATWPAVVEFKPLPAATRSRIGVRASSSALAVAVLGFVVSVPLWLSPSVTYRASDTVAVSLVVLSIVVLTGWAGQVSLGQMSFAALGGAVAALAVNQWHLDLSLTLVLAGMAAAAASVLVGLPAIRLGGLFTAVTTLVAALAASGYLLASAEFSWIPHVELTRTPLFGFIPLNSP